MAKSRRNEEKQRSEKNNENGNIAIVMWLRQLCQPVIGGENRARRRNRKHLKEAAAPESGNRDNNDNLSKQLMASENVM
jgi:hypothetical protein